MVAGGAEKGVGAESRVVEQDGRTETLAALFDGEEKEDFVGGL